MNHERGLHNYTIRIHEFFYLVNDERENGDDASG